jgi:hypothetical protein
MSPKGTLLEKAKPSRFLRRRTWENRCKARTNRGKAKHDQGQCSKRHHVKSDKIRRDETTKTPKRLLVSTVQMKN